MPDDEEVFYVDPTLKPAICKVKFSSIEKNWHELHGQLTDVGGENPTHFSKAFRRCLDRIY
eukprot:1764016-Karenia_brevis.AAC.1